jgi:uncharacterized protein (TIGR02145 family)
MKNLLLSLMFAMLFFNAGCKKDSGNPVNQNPTAPSAPVLSSPANNSVGISIPPTLHWNACSGASSYNVEVNIDSNFLSSGFSQIGLTTTSYLASPPMSDQTKYYWHVCAVNSYGTSPYSATWNFTTSSGSAPSVPSLSAPANNTISINLPPTLSWNLSSGADSYRLQISTGSSFTSTVYDNADELGNSQQIPDLDYSTKYYWHVNAKNNYGTSAWSDTWSFTTFVDSTACPSIPNIIYAGRTYHTVQIASQCWLKENLNVGTMVSGSGEQTDNNLIEKYCYNNDSANCTAYGGLYQWNEAMQYSTLLGAQGICPGGWHIPTSVELQTLQSTVNSDGNSLKAIGQGSGLGTGTNTTGFSALLSGYRKTDHSFINIGTGIYYWSSTQSTSPNAFIMYLNDMSSNILILGYYDENSGFSIRCLMN